MGQDVLIHSIDVAHASLHQKLLTTSVFMPRKKKVFVLDTNVILHDESCIHQFEEHDVVIPITVIEELDKFKKGKDIINVNAREFLRSLDSITGQKIFDRGVSLGPKKGNISICLEKERHERLRTNFGMDKPDHHILNTAYFLAEAHGFDRVVMVTKDVNLRMKAKAIGLAAENYKTDQVTDIADLHTGRRMLKGIDSALIDRVFAYPFEIEASELPECGDLIANEYLILRNGSKSALAMYHSQSASIRKLDSNRSAFGIFPRNSEQIFALDALMNDNIPLVTLTGKAGTGKTLLALAAALEGKQCYRQIFVARPAVPLSNKDIGYLPGDIHSKLDPYMQPLHDNLSVIQNQYAKGTGKTSKVKELLEEEKIIVTPLSYIRGRSIVKVFFIVDEAQNLTPHEVKTIITRAGEGTKIVMTGDIYQIGHPYLDSRSNGLSYLIEKMKGQPLYAHVHLEKGERSELSELASKLL